MKLYKFADDQDQMWIEDAEGKAHQIASISFALEGVDVTEIENAREWAQAYAEQHASITNEYAEGAFAESDEEEMDEDALMDESDINEMARHLVMLIEHRQREAAAA